MKKRFIVISTLGSISFASVISLVLTVGGRSSLLKASANRGVNNILSLESQKISDRTDSYNEEISSVIYTANNNEIEFKCSNVIDFDQGWQSILPNGYFYNPINTSAHNNKITGLYSVRFNSNSSSTLSLSYGYTLDNENIVYSNDKELAPNITYELEDLNPSYLYVKNNNDTTVDIGDFIITYSCEETEYPMQDLTILMIGNSFADDTVFYTERVAASYGINLHLYDAYIGGCTINTHYSNFNSDAASYSMRNVINGSWNYQNDMTLKQIINSNTWDIITFQQASAEVGRSNTYSNLSNLVSAVRNLVGENPKFYWHQTWAYDKDYHDYYDYFAYFNNDQTEMYNAIVSCYLSEVVPLGVFDKLIPAGTAVQNLRTSYMKDTFSRDGKHMSSVHGRYLLSLNFLSSVYDIDLEKSECGYLPPEVDPSFKRVAYEAVKNARKNPLNCTNSLYKTRELANYNLSEYTEIDAELLGCSYWDPTNESNYNKRISNASGTSNYYSTTKRFSQSELPIGSLVVIDDSFGIRPVYWVSDSVQGSKPAEMYPNVLEIDSSFWNGYQYRAFNIFKAGKTELKGQYDQIFDGFHIYVPNYEMGPLVPKSNNASYGLDSVLFDNNGLNIDYYERMHLDPITGFYKCDSYYELTNSYVDDTAKKFVCSRPFYSANNDLPEGTVIIVDDGYQWRSDCWGANGSYSPRPGNVTTKFTVLTSSFWEGFRRRTFNVSSTSSSYVNQNYIAFMNHMRIYTPLENAPDTPVAGITISQNYLSMFTGQTTKLKVSIIPAYATNKNVLWESENSGIATVDQNGNVYGVAAGSTVIKATTEDGGYVASCNVDVTETIQNYPTGTFKGTVEVDGLNFPLVLTFGTQSNGLFAARLDFSNLYAYSMSVNDSTNVVSIYTDGYFNGYSTGVISGAFDKENNQIKNVSFDGSISTGAGNNGSILLEAAVSSNDSFYADCDGTTSELQAQFKRRYMSGSWQVDNSNADRFTSNTTEFVSGTGSVKRRGYGSNAVSLNLNNDFTNPIAATCLDFWVYNPSNGDITMRMWIYRSTGLGDNSELSNVVAKANQWTHIVSRMNHTIYNFQIADFTNSGVYLSFDNIYIY